MILLYVQITATKRKRESQGRDNIASGVDVIGVRSVSEAAENQSFLRTTLAGQAVLVSEQRRDEDRPESHYWVSI